MDTAVRELARAIAGGGSISAHDLRRLRLYLEAFLDADRLDGQIEEYETWAEANSAPVLQAGFRHRPLDSNALVADIWACRDWEMTKADMRPPPGAMRLGRLAADMAVLENHAASSFDEAAREFLQQQLQAAGQFWGVVHEIGTAAYLIAKGAHIDPSFLIKSSHPDIVASWSGIEVPVECKAKPPGAGRAISVETFSYMAGCIARDASDAGRKVLVRITSTGDIRGKDAERLRRAVRDSGERTSGDELVFCGDRTYSVSVISMSGTFTLGDAKTHLGQYDFHMQMMVIIPGTEKGQYQLIAAVGLGATPDETPWGSLRSSIMDGGIQLEAGSPGIVAVHYVDHVDDLEALRPGTRRLGQEIANLVGPLAHVAGVMVSSEPDLQPPYGGAPGQVRVYDIERRLPRGSLVP